MPRPQQNLTIGVLTYNRPQKVREALACVAGALAERRVEVLLIDDGDNLATREVAANYVGRPGFTYLRNNANLGYARTLCRLIEACETPYIMPLADDDLPEVANIDIIDTILTKERPAFASPMYRRGGDVYRGVEISRAIAAKDYMSCCGHISGLIFRVDVIKSLLSRLYDRLSLAKEDAVFYPQTLMVIAILLMNESAMFVGHVSAFDNGETPSENVNNRGHSYWCYESRLQQFAALDEFIMNFPTENADGRKEMLRAHRTEFARRVLSSWEQADAIAATIFEREVARHYVAKYLPTGVRKILRRVSKI